MFSALVTFALAAPPCAPPDTFARDAFKKAGSVKTTTIHYSTRPPVGDHTHSHWHVDADGRKHLHTFDHKSNPGSHHCNVLVIRNGKVVPCGAFQNVQDPHPRPVTVATMASSVAPMAPSIQRSIQRSNCPNGNCPLATPFR